MNAKVKFALKAFVPLFLIIVAISTLFLLDVLELFHVILIILIVLPYDIAYYAEYSSKAEDERENISPYYICKNNAI